MKNGFSAFKLGAVAIGLVGTVSCSQPAPVAPVAPAPEVGRYQVVVTSEGERGSVLFLVDTKEGSTWIYRPPQGPLFNGFWSDIPRVTNPAETWQQAFQQLVMPRAGAAPTVPATPPSAPSGTTR
jgi:hypothetical protein